MNPLLKKLTESQETNPALKTPKPILVASRPVEYWQCPHCSEEIHEHHTYVEEGVEFHKDCGGALIRPPYDWSNVDPKWRTLLEPHADS